MERVCQFLKDAGVYFLATAEGKQSRIWPYSTAHVLEGKLYMMAGRGTVNQIRANPRAELCACHEGKWVIVSGELVEDEREEIAEAMLRIYPEMRELYDFDGGWVLYFKDPAVRFFGEGGEK